MSFTINNQEVTFDTYMILADLNLNQMISAFKNSFERKILLCILAYFRKNSELLE